MMLPATPMRFDRGKRTSIAALQEKLDQLYILARRDDREAFLSAYLPHGLEAKERQIYEKNFSGNAWDILCSEIVTTSSGADVSEIEETPTRCVFRFPHPVLDGYSREVGFRCVGGEWRADCGNREYQDMLDRVAPRAEGGTRCRDATLQSKLDRLYFLTQQDNREAFVREILGGDPNRDREKAITELCRDRKMWQIVRAECLQLCSGQGVVEIDEDAEKRCCFYFKSMLTNSDSKSIFMKTSDGNWHGLLQCMVEAYHRTHREACEAELNSFKERRAREAAVAAPRAEGGTRCRDAALQAKLDRLFLLSEQDNREAFVREMLPSELGGEDGNDLPGGLESVKGLCRDPEIWRNVRAEIQAICSGQGVVKIDETAERCIFFLKHRLTGCTGTSVFKNHSDGGWHGLLQIIAGEILRQAQELHCEELRSMEADIAARTVDGARAPDDDTRACRACERLLPRASFSKKQWSSAAKRRCIECVETGAEAPRPAEIGETVETPFEDIEPFRVAGFDARTS